MPKRRTRKHKPSAISSEEFHLDIHDEEKVLLFTSGILFGVGLSVSVTNNTFWYGWLSALATGIVLLFIEARQLRKQRL